MNSKSHLTPETITDVNGKVTTVYRKNGAAGPVPKAVIPAPAPAPASLPFDRVEYISELLSYWSDHNTNSFDEDEIIGKFWELEDATLLAIDIDYQLDSGDGERMEAIYDWVGYYGEEREEYLRELVTYAGTFADDRSANFIEESIVFLKDSGVLPPMTDYSQAGPDLEKGIRNILSITEAVFSDQYMNVAGDVDNVFPVLPNELLTLILSRPDDVERIKQIATTRDTMDAEFVRSVLDSDAPAVSEGVL